MISLEQIRLLEKKVSAAVHLIEVLKEENKMLKRTIESSQKRMQELEELVTAFKNDQTAIEASVLNAIQKLDVLEDEVSGWEAGNKASPAPAEKTGPEPAAADKLEPAAMPEPVAAHEPVADFAEKKTELTPEVAEFNLDTELEEDDTVITVDDIQAQRQTSADPAGFQNSLLSDQDEAPQVQQSHDAVREQLAAGDQPNFLFFNQYDQDKIDKKQHEPLTMGSREEPAPRADGHHLHGAHHLFQNKIYVQRQTEYKELDIF